MPLNFKFLRASVLGVWAGTGLTDRRTPLLNVTVCREGRINSKQSQRLAGKRKRRVSR